MKKISNPYHMQEFKKVESLEEKIQLFPFLKTISSKKSLENIVKIIDKLANAEYEPNSKYNIMWDILQLGSLLERELPEEIKEGVTLQTLDPVEQRLKKCSELEENQQWCLFKIARNITADACHLMYEDQVTFFVNQVKLLCRGENVKDSLSKISQEFSKIISGKGATKQLVSREAQIKIFQQAGYFLERTKIFLIQENAPAAGMALIGAGNCCRAILVGKFAGKTPLPCVKEMIKIRTELCHGLDQSAEVSRLEESVNLMSGKIDRYVIDLTKDASSLGLEIDVKNYTQKEKPTEDHESPRGYDK